MKALELIEIEEVSGGKCTWYEFGLDVVKGGIGSLAYGATC